MSYEMPAETPPKPKIPLGIVITIPSSKDEKHPIPPQPPKDKRSTNPTWN